MPVQLLLLLIFSAPPTAGQNSSLSLPEVIQLFQLDTMNKLRQTIQDQESVISEQQKKITKLEYENANFWGFMWGVGRCGEEEALERIRSNVEQCEINRQKWSDSLIDLDIKQLYIDVMKDMKLKFQNGDLNQDQKIAATGVITETQSLLSHKSFEVLGLQIGDMTSVQIFEVLKGWKEAGNMTSQQNSAMEDLAEHSQVRMIQGLLGVFGYTPEQAAQSYKWSAEDLRLFLQLPTFGSDLDYSEFEIDIDYSEPDIDYTDWVWDQNMD